MDILAIGILSYLLLDNKNQLGGMKRSVVGRVADSRVRKIKEVLRKMQEGSEIVCLNCRRRKGIRQFIGKFKLSDYEGKTLREIDKIYSRRANRQLNHIKGTLLNKSISLMRKMEMVRRLDHLKKKQCVRCRAIAAHDKRISTSVTATFDSDRINKSIIRNISSADVENSHQRYHNKLIAKFKRLRNIRRYCSQIYININGINERWEAKLIKRLQTLVPNATSEKKGFRVFIRKNSFDWTKSSDTFLGDKKSNRTLNDVLNVKIGRSGTSNFSASKMSNLNAQDYQGYIPVYDLQQYHRNMESVDAVSKQYSMIIFIPNEAIKYGYNPETPIIDTGVYNTSEVNYGEIQRQLPPGHHVRGQEHIIVNLGKIPHISFTIDSLVRGNPIMDMLLFPYVGKRTRTKIETWQYHIKMMEARELWTDVTNKFAEKDRPLKHLIQDARAIWNLCRETGRNSSAATPQPMEEVPSHST